MDILADIFSGLGLFFIGVRMLGAAMKQASGRRFRNMLAKTGGHPLGMATMGMLCGALMQSTNAVTFILISLVTGNILDLRKAGPILAWANVGTSVLVFLATLNIHVATLYLLGLVGFGHFFRLDEHARLRNLIAASFSIGLMFLGLGLIKEGTVPLQKHALVIEFIHYAESSDVLTFLGGLAATLVVQSAATVSAIALAMASSGLLQFDHTVMIMLGSNLGSGLATFLLAGNLSGTGKQLAMTQFLIKGFGSLVLLPLMMGSADTQLLALADASGISQPQQLALAYLFLQLVSVIVYLPGSGWFCRILEKHFPPHPSQTLSQPRYLYDQALDEPETGLDLLEKEQGRLVAYLPRHFDRHRPGEYEGPMLESKAVLQSTRELAGVCEHFIERLMLMGGGRSPHLVERLSRARTRNDLLLHLHEGCHTLNVYLETPFTESAGQTFRHNLIEGLCALLIVLEDLVESPDLQNLTLAKSVSSERSGVMKRLRESLIDPELGLGQTTQSRLLPATSLFERLVWLIHQYVLAIDIAVDAGESPEDARLDESEAAVLP